MENIPNIETHLIEHPDDHAQRWRLAKKLYTACEYRDALSHLLILKRDADWKLNYSRYLAATYYRLGRYDECIHELHGALESWPVRDPRPRAAGPGIRSGVEHGRGGAGLAGYPQNGPAASHRGRSPSCG
ncbi:MAG: tetratricopeptide repeat protein [Candidatus Hydrogenedentales bacterium]